MGIEGQSRPDKIVLQKKIEIARTSLMMKAQGDTAQFPATIAKNRANYTSNSIKLAHGLKARLFPAH
ncbi:MAG: hypothetical protein HC930_06625 [Hydrococcus sp. SU_1_0]|nr:hypothetical protein [Hydrococcus sp. SU_1_0]